MAAREGASGAIAENVYSFPQNAKLQNSICW